ncbi:MAG: hypothetical protein R2832_00385 [Rhodothermales bacterium]
MGRAILVLAAAILLGLVTISYGGQQTRMATDETSADYEYKVVARDIAHSGLDKALSDTRTKLMAGQKSWSGVEVAGGSYDATVTDNMYGDMTIEVEARTNDVVHSVQSNVIFESPFPAAVVLSGDDIQSMGVGNGFRISGMDMRSPSRGAGNGFLRPVYGIMANSATNASSAMSNMPAGSIVGQGGDASITSGVDITAYESLYLEALSSASLVSPLPPYSGTYGTVDNPTVVRVTGDFSPTGNFSGAGLLIIEDGDVNISGSFDWEGLVLIRRVAVPNVSIQLGGNATIHGGLIAMESTGASSSTECVDVPFSIDGIQTVPQVPFAVRFDVLGAAISAGGAYDMPVTSMVHLGTSDEQPWGSYANPIAANLNTGTRFEYEPDQLFEAGTGITVSARSWSKLPSQNGDQVSEWEISMEQNSAAGGSQLTVLRNGDNVPDLSGYLDQASAASFVAEYIGDDGTMHLADNQTIYLFELGTTNSHSAAWDMQDLVVLVTLARADAGCEVVASTAGSISFEMGGSAAVQFSGEAIAKLGQVLPSVRASSKVVVAAQKEMTAN